VAVQRLNLERCILRKWASRFFSEIDRYTLEDGLIELFYHLRIPDGTYEEVPMGVFEISEANRHIRCLEIKAYDYMLRFEKDFNTTDTIGNAYEIISLCCKACGVEFAHRQNEIESMPNGNIVLSIYAENDIETYRDVLFYIGQILGGFFFINRSGKLELKKLWYRGCRWRSVISSDSPAAFLILLPDIRRSALRI